MSQFPGSPGPIPNRWLKCPRKSLGLIADKFLVFKTPLNSRYDEQVPIEDRFPPSMILGLKPYKNKIGLWIDLTNTTRFYDKREIQDAGCIYHKLQCRGHGETPSQEQCNVFVNLVEQFISQNPLSQIGVHCTHGFNRSGFLICTYLVLKRDCSVESALMQFQRARPPGIYKEDYIKELYRQFDDVDDAPPAPELPDWCNEYDDAEDDTNEVSASGEQNSGKRVKKDAKFMEGVKGVYHFKQQPEVHKLQKKIQRMCKFKNKDFPGSQPVSMDMVNIALLQDHPYRVSWKADGMRYMMLIKRANEVYFFDRDNNVFKVEGISFPRRDNPEAHVEDTLVDGEMVIDQVNGESIPRFLVYDIVQIFGTDIGTHAFEPDRLRCIQKELIEPRHKAIIQGRINKVLEPFSIRPKEFWHVTQAASLLGDKFSKQLSHEPDGLIFQPSKEPYTPGRCDLVLKWKPASLNSVDFKLKIITESGPGIVPKKIGALFVGQMDIPFDKIKLNAQLRQLDNKIIECKRENNAWVFMRERTDKSFPNSLTTATAVVNSITNPVTKEYLLDFINRYRYNDDSERMKPPPPPRSIQNGPAAKKARHY